MSKARLYPWWGALFFVLALSAGGVAKADSARQQLLVDASKKGLAQHTTWHALGHYRGTPSRPGKSRVLNEEFFLHPDGRRDPTLELQATLLRYFDPVVDGDEAHPRCRFPARYEWLSEHLVFPESSSAPPQCKGLAKWRAHTDAGSAALVFVDGHFGNPASFFGHALLVFGSQDTSQQEMLNTSVNFGAVVPKDENPIAYIFKGLLGGYKAGFSSLEFFHHEHNYSDMNQRNMWRFDLDMSTEDVHLLVSHLWELSTVRFQYFFLKDNCGFEMMELVKVVTPQLEVASKPWFAPLDLFLALNDLEGKPGGAVRVTARPSRFQAFRSHYWSATPRQRRAIAHHARQLRKPEEHVRTAAPPADPVVLDALLLYTELPGVITEARVPQQRQQWLRERVSMPAQKRPSEPDAGSPPSRRQRTTMLQLGGGWQTNGKAAANLRFRPAYTDLTSIGTGLHDAYTLIAGDVLLQFTEQAAWVRSFDLLRVESMGIPKTPVSLKQGWAWRVRTGGRTRSLSCQGCFDVDLEAGAGKGVRIGQRAAASALLTTTARTAPSHEGQISGGAAGVLLSNVTAAWRAEIRVDHRYYLGVWNPETEWSMTHRFGSSPHRDLCLNARAAGSEFEIGAGVGLYW